MADHLGQPMPVPSWSWSWQSDYVGLTTPAPSFSWESPSARANRLLWSKLTESQRRTFRRGYFDVTGSRGGKYRIDTSSDVQNIRSRGIFRRWENFCVTPFRYQPTGDVLLSQKLLIESDEDQFRRVAVRSFLGWTS